MANKLIRETSPYLLQHAHNPVDWYPWGSEALDRAKKENKPILLSVGYSACHWCHVMERESFENPNIASLMNKHFICIKVDREERPDIDSIYMSAVQLISGQGGWPMTVFLTPDGKPFYGGTYFPPEDRRGMPGFPKVLQVMSDTYHNKHNDVIMSTEKLLEQMCSMSSETPNDALLTRDVMDGAFHGIQNQFDDQYGGTGMQPKFPQPMIYEFLLRYHLRTGKREPLDMVTLTLDRMAGGGIYDHLGGGFHRYSTDMFWLVPHFEKMLYDNALLVKLYLHAYQVTRVPLYRRVVEDTLDYVLREMTSPEGGFYSSQDADSEGEEGKFFVWRPEQIIEVLGKERGEIINHHFGVTLKGNFEGRTILHTPMSPSSTQPDVEDVGITSILEQCKTELLQARELRIHPDRDDKVLTAWNALMMGAFAEAGAVLERPDYVRAGQKNAVFLLANLENEERLLRTYKGGQAKLLAYLEDYAFLISNLLTLHEATFDARWVDEAIRLGHSMVKLFWDESTGHFYDTGLDHEELVIRPRDTTDNAIPSGNSMAAEALLKLAVVSGDTDFERLAIDSLHSAHQLMTRYPGAAGQYLCTLDTYLTGSNEIAVIGEITERDTAILMAEIYNRFIPNRIILGKQEEEDRLGELPLMNDRAKIDGRATVYVCENFICKMPVTDPVELAALLSDEPG